MKSVAPALSYTNRHGDAYYVHAGTDRLGEPRYFVSLKIGKGALASLPAGFEIVESNTGRVSVCPIGTKPAAIPDRHLARVRAELAKRSHLRRHRAQVVNGEILIYEPDNVADYLMMPSFRLAPAPVEEFRPEFDERMTYSPVMRLVPVERQYAVSRMTPMSRYWSLALDQGSLGRIVSKYVKTIGTEKFFELCSPQSETVAKSTGVRR